MRNKKIILQFSIVTLIILLAALSRLIPHPANFAPIGAMSLFGAVYFAQRKWAFIIPIVSMWISDLILNNVVYGQYFDSFVWFYPGFYWTYGSFIVIALIGFFFLKKISVGNVIGSSLTASVIFFLLSNFGVWGSTTMYSHDWNGILNCYIAALPFFKNTILGDLVYSSILFGAFETAKHYIPSLRLKESI